MTHTTQTKQQRKNQSHKQRLSGRAAKHARAMPKILCADDDPAIVAAIELRLREYQVEVLCAYSGAQAFWQATTRRPHLIITDLRMPQGNGSYLIESLKGNALTEGIPVVVLTGLREEHLAARLERLGADDLLHKPISIDALTAMIARYVRLLKRDHRQT